MTGASKDEFRVETGSKRPGRGQALLLLQLIQYYQDNVNPSMRMEPPWTHLESSSLRPDHLNLQALQHHHTEKHPRKTSLSSKPTQTTILPLLLLLRTYEIYTFSGFQEPDISLTIVMHYSSVSLEDFCGRHPKTL